MGGVTGALSLASNPSRGPNVRLILPVSRKPRERQGGMSGTARHHPHVILRCKTFADEVQRAPVSDGRLQWAGRHRVQFPEPCDSRPWSPAGAVRPQRRTRDVLALLRRVDRATEGAVAAGMGPRRLAAAPRQSYSGTDSSRVCVARHFNRRGNPPPVPARARSSGFGRSQREPCPADSRVRRPRRDERIAAGPKHTLLEMRALLVRSGRRSW